MFVGNCQILLDFQKIFASNSFQIRGCPDPEYFSHDPDPDPAKSFGSDRIRIYNTTQKGWVQVLLIRL
jgi:hypothetical protein